MPLSCPRIYVCGRLAIEHPAGVLLERDFPARQGRRFWAYLVLNRQQPVSRGDLAEAVWGDDVPDAWGTSLNAIASRLRRLIVPFDAPGAPFAISGEPGRYRLVLPEGAFVDHERARAAIHDADRCHAAGRHEEALAEARVALEIAARGFLPGEEGPWVTATRDALASIRLRAQERTVEAELARGRPEWAEAEAEALIALDPLRESGYRLLMRALAASGNRAQVAWVHRRCRDALLHGAGIAPSASTDALYRELVGGK